MCLHNANAFANISIAMSDRTSKFCNSIFCDMQSEIQRPGQRHLRLVVVVIGGGGGGGSDQELGWGRWG